MGAVVVVGGGVAGLSCAWKLRRAGHEVEVLERESEAGGRMRSEWHDGFRLDRGAQFVASGYRNLHALAAELGIDDRVQELPPPREAVLLGGQLHALDLAAPGSLLRSSLLSGAARRRLLRLPLELLRQRRRLDPLRPERAAGLDAENLVEGSTRRFGAEATELLLAPAFSATFDSEPEDLSYGFALLALRQLLSGHRLQTFEGGVGLLTRELAACLPVRGGCEVIAVETETAGARVRYRTQGRERRVVADAAVVALPGSVVPSCCPKLTPEERGFFESLRSANGAIVHLLLERPPETLANLSGVAFPRPEGLDLYGLAVAHDRPGAVPEGAGLLNVALRAPVAARLRGASDDAVVALVLENLGRTPVGRLAPLRSVVHRWDPLLPQFGVGQLDRLARFHTRIERSPRLAFAGDHLVGPFAEGAVSSGLRAATEIARAL